MNFFGHGAEIVWPEYSSVMDYELELGFVLAKPLYNASPEQAEAAIGGFVVFNDSRPATNKCRKCSPVLARKNPNISPMLSRANLSPLMKSCQR